ncbi:alpha/beta hydrolase [Paenibacillus sp. DMB5]|uniref:alpha/beta fold hydrolase n=1 Tax=Paenibacillus sp. DMB5 TaxID=1780103 RepID=UPI00076BC297|nr:alpha/beta hydrolase [Paenibacillus sp. DMB5]KUP21682.1 alpha/beta hydrolase [Paenibacillus sp. DMB5]
MKEFFVKKANCMLRYNDFHGEQTPILFIHGLGCASSFDYPQVATQEGLKKHRCILVDLLGAGYSDKPDNSDFDYTVNDHAEYLAEFVNSLGLKSFVLFGHSLGGAVALSLATKCREHIDRIILSEANLDKSVIGSTSKYIADLDMHDFLDNGFSRLVQDSRISGNQMWAAVLSSWSPKAAYLISKSAAKGEEPTWRETLYSLECSKTFIFGENSLPDSDMEVLSTHNINIEIVKNAGHSMAWENPEGLAKAIENGIQTK